MLIKNKEGEIIGFLIVLQQLLIVQQCPSPRHRKNKDSGARPPKWKSWLPLSLPLCP
jgi:hypothetical protein